MDRCEDSSIYDQNMSQGSSNPASPSRPAPASDQQETITLVSHVFGLSEVSTSLEALNIEVERKPTVVHRAQTSYSPGASMTPWSLKAGITRDPPRPHLTSQRGMPSRYGWKLRWDLDTSYLPRTIPAPQISPLRF